MSRFAFALASEHDEAELRQVFGQNSMEGDIELAFRREPNYFHGAQTQGPFCQVVAAHDGQTDEVIGVGTRAVRPGFLNGQIAEVGYLGDLRLDARYRGGPLVARAYRYLAQLHQ